MSSLTASNAKQLDMTKWKYFDIDITCTKLHSTHFHNTLQTKSEPAATAYTGTHLRRGLSYINFTNYLSRLLLCYTYNETET